MISSCVKINKSDGAKPPTFRLDSWEDLARSLFAFPPDVGLYALHIDLKNAFWSFCLPLGARQVFVSGPPPGPRLWRCRACRSAGNTARICAKRVWPAFSGGYCPPRYSLCTISMTTCLSSLIGRCSGSHLSHHQAVLRSLARVLWVSGIVVRLVWVPSALQPVDPMSRVASVFGGSQARAEVEAGARGIHCWIIWARPG